jgi:hypothetical protein
MTMHEPPTDYERLLAIAESERAPLALREAIEADRRRVSKRSAAGRRLRLGAALAAGVAVVAVVAGLVVPGGGGDGPTVLEAAGLGVRPAVAAAPAVRKSHPETLEAAVGGVRFPAWGADQRWSASGQRSDKLDGRKAETVFYTSRRGARLGYTIIDGDALPWPKGSRRVVRRGVPVYLLRDGGRLIAAWRVGGRTCVISAPSTVSESRLVELASTSAYA